MKNEYSSMSDMSGSDNDDIASTKENKISNGGADEPAANIRKKGSRRVRMPSTKVKDPDFVIGTDLKDDMEDDDDKVGEKTNKDRIRMINFVCPLELPMLEPGNLYGLTKESLEGFKLGDRVCIKSYYCDDGKWEKQVHKFIFSY